MPEKILVMSLTRMGDLVQATPLISGLRKKHPKAGITLMVSSDFAGFASRVPDIDDTLVLEIRQFTEKEKWKDLSWVDIYRYLEGFLNGIRERRYDLVVNLSHSRLSALMILFLGIKNVRGFMCNEIGDRMTEHPWMQYFGIEPFNRIYNPFNLVEIFTRSGDIDPKNLSIRITEPQDAGPEVLEKFSGDDFPDGEFIVGIQAGSSLEDRRWPLKCFAELADLLVEELNARIILFGVASESIVAQAIVSQMKWKDRAVDLTGRTNIPQLIHWLKKCRYLVTNDTGTMHIAAALGTKIVGLFFAHAHPFETGPYSPGHVIFQARIPCAPCSYGVSCSNIICIQKIHPMHVFSLIRIHRGEGEWRLSNSMKSLDEVNIFQTRYGKDHRLELQPLIHHPLTVNDVFLWSYNRLWLDSLSGVSNRENPNGLVQLVEKFGEDYDCGNIGGVLKVIREKIDRLQDLVRLSECGNRIAEKIARISKGTTVQLPELKGVGEEITGLDEQINLIGNTHPEVKPITSIFGKRKENFNGDDVNQLAVATQACYQKLGEESGAMIYILEKIVEAFNPVSDHQDQILSQPINAAVPGR